MSEQPDRGAMMSDLAAMEKRIGEMIGASAIETRRHFDAVVESIRADFRAVVDKTNAVGEKVDRLITRNAIEHAALVDAITDREVRLRVLEKTRAGDTPSHP